MTALTVSRFPHLRQSLSGGRNPLFPPFAEIGLQSIKHNDHVVLVADMPVVQRLCATRARRRDSSNPSRIMEALHDIQISHPQVELDGVPSAERNTPLSFKEPCHPR
jgi:hypothetical protein